jgi:hypothetical protein
MSSDNVYSSPLGPRFLDVDFSSAGSSFNSAADLGQLSQETVSGADEKISISELNVS